MVSYLILVGDVSGVLMVRLTLATNGLLAKLEVSLNDGEYMVFLGGLGAKVNFSL